MAGYTSKEYFVPLLLFWFALMQSSLSGQMVTVNGLAIDRNSLKGVPYVTVSVAGSGVVTTSSPDGYFSFEVQATLNWEIEVTSVGYIPKMITVPVNYSGDTLTVYMEESFINVNDVVVTATRNTRSIREVPVLTRIINRDEIQRTASTSVTDIISSYSSFADFYNEGRGMTFRTQGLSTKYTLFLVDGERVAGENRDNIDYYRLNAATLERIEIIPGASSSLYGSNAIGSVINLITRKPVNPFEASFLSRFSNFNEFENSVSTGGNLGSFNFFANALRRSAAGYDNTPVETPDLWTVEPFEVHSAFARINYKAGENLDVGARLSLYSRERFNAADHRPVHPLYTDMAGGVSVNWQISSAIRAVGSIYKDRYRTYDVFERLNDSRQKTYQNSQTTSRVTISSEAVEIAKATHSFIGGVEYFVDDMYAERIEGSSSVNHVISIFLQDEIDIGKSISLVTGARADYNSEYGNAFSPKVSLMYRTGSVNLRGSYAKGFRAPGIKERFYDFDISFITVKGNKNLVPEESTYYSLSAEYLSTAGNYSVNLYRNNITNMIHEVKLEEIFNGYTYENFLNVIVKGIDLSARSRLANLLYMTASYSFNDVYDSGTGDQLIGVSRHAATFMMDYHHRWRRVTAGALMAAKLYGSKEFVNIDYHTGEMFNDTYPAFSIWRLSGSCYLFSNSVQITAGIDNLLDFKAVSDIICNEPGRRFFLSVNITINKLYNHF